MDVHVASYSGSDARAYRTDHSAGIAQIKVIQHGALYYGIAEKVVYASEVQFH